MPILYETYIAHNIVSSTDKTPNTLLTYNACNNNYDTENEYVKVHHFQLDPDKKQRWINALVSILPKEPTQDMVAWTKHWPCN